MAQARRDVADVPLLALWRSSGARGYVAGARVDLTESYPERPARRGAPSRRSAFTLVELVITILLMAILAATAAPKFAGALRTMRLESACRRVRADLAFARQSAIARSVTQAVQFTANSSIYLLPGMSGLDRPSSSYLVNLGIDPYQSRVVSATLGGDAIVQFDRFGMPDSGGVVTVACGSATGTVTLNASTGLASIP